MYLEVIFPSHALLTNSKVKFESPLKHIYLEEGYVPPGTTGMSVQVANVDTCNDWDPVKPRVLTYIPTSSSLFTDYDLRKRQNHPVIRLYADNATKIADSPACRVPVSQPVAYCAPRGRLATEETRYLANTEPVSNTRLHPACTSSAIHTREKASLTIAAPRPVRSRPHWLVADGLAQLQLEMSQSDILLKRSRTTDMRVQLQTRTSIRSSIQS